MIEKDMMQSVLFLLVLFIGSSGSSEIGDPCRTARDCKLYQIREVFLCEDGACKCHPDIELEYDRYGGKPKCNDWSYTSEMFKANCNETSCEENAECVELTSSDFLFIDVEVKKKRCRCKQDYLRIKGDCRGAFYQKPFQSCATPSSGPIPICNASEFTRCMEEKCACTDNRFYNSTSKTCEPMANYVAAFNLSSYRVKPGEYCSKSSHCIDGLKCQKFECSCPSQCPYNSTEEICDCGVGPAPQVDFPVGPLIIGIILGILIMIFWVSRIKKTIDAHTTKVTVLSSTLLESTRGNQESYPFRPVVSGAPTAPVGFGSTSSRDNEFQYPSAPPTMPSAPPTMPNDSAFPKVEGGGGYQAVSPPQSSLYGINPPQASNSFPLPPPPYSEKPLDTDGIPSYSINPPIPEGFTPPPPPSYNSASSELVKQAGNKTYE